MGNIVDEPLAYFFAEKVCKLLVFPEVFKFRFQGANFGLFIVLPLHKESLRDMVQRGSVNNQIKIKVLRSLIPIVADDRNSHGDIKKSFNSFLLEFSFE